MSIYKPTFLYIKQHSLTGLLYFGKHTGNDPINYFGSGKYWSKHIAKHGKAYVITLWYELFTSEDGIKEFALYFSENMDIVNSSEWANLKPETGIDGGCVSRSIESRLKQSVTAKSKNRKCTKEHRDHMSNIMVGKNKGKTQSVATKEKHRLSILGKNKGKIHPQELTDKQTESRRKNLIDGCSPYAKIHDYTIEFLLGCVFTDKLSAKDIHKKFNINKAQLIKKLSAHGHDPSTQLQENAKLAQLNHYNRNKS